MEATPRTAAAGRRAGGDAHRRGRAGRRDARRDRGVPDGRLVRSRATSPIDGHAAGGFAWTGPLPGRPLDVTGLGATYAHFPDGTRRREDFELAVETFYRIRLTRWVSIKPDLQYIVHPGGSSGTRRPVARGDALVFTLRLEMSF